MSAFSSLSSLWQALIPLVLFCEIILELGLFLYRLLRSPRPLGILLWVLYFGILVALLLSVTQGDPDEGKDAFLLEAPWLIFAFGILFAAVHFAAVLVHECRSRKNRLSPFSIKEATDELPMGICFSDPEGRIILCNNRMRRLAFALWGQELQTAEDLQAALARPGEGVTVKDDCYILPDQTVWQFRTQHITVDGDCRWQQMTAQNVTEVWVGNLRQEEINRELREVNGKLQKLYRHMADDIRERERLELKIHIHDAIGRSLLTIRDIMDSGQEAEKKLEVLQEALGALTSDRAAPRGTPEEARQAAEALGVRIETEGSLPQGSMAEKLTLAALGECVTNCVKHAGGDTLFLRITGDAQLYDITITNNGKAPVRPIREGSGLTSLRRSIEGAGGQMQTAYAPRFALLLTLPRKEHDL